MRSSTSFSSPTEVSEAKNETKNIFPSGFSKNFEIIREAGKVFNIYLFIICRFYKFLLKGFQATVYKAQNKITKEIFAAKVYVSIDLESIEHVFI